MPRKWVFHKMNLRLNKSEYLKLLWAVEQEDRNANDLIRELIRSLPSLPEGVEIDEFLKTSEEK